MRMMTAIAVYAAAALLAACGGERGSGEMAVQDTTAVAGEARDGMSHGMGESALMMKRMQMHMLTMEEAGPDSTRAMMPMHRQMAANMIAQMNREMSDMNMPADTAWIAVVDSLREDLARMPALTPAQMHAMMPGHRRRLERLMSMHRAMMGSMRM